MSGRRIIRFLLLLCAGAASSSLRLCGPFFSGTTRMELDWCCVFFGPPPRGASFLVMLKGIRPPKRQRGGEGMQYTGYCHYYCCYKSQRLLWCVCQPVVLKACPQMRAWGMNNQALHGTSLSLKRFGLDIGGCGGGAGGQLGGGGSILAELGRAGGRGKNIVCCIYGLVPVKYCRETRTRLRWEQPAFCFEPIRGGLFNFLFLFFVGEFRTHRRLSGGSIKKNAEAGAGGLAS